MKKSIASRWWPERLRIALCPDRFVVARMGLGWQSRVLDKRIVECPSEQHSRHPWQAPLAVLDAMLDDVEKPNAAATIILSNHFVRYTVVPWRDGIANRAEHIALAGHCFKNIFGGVASTWDIRVSDGGFQCNSLASAIDRELLTQLDQLFTKRNLTLSSVQPYFMAAYNRFRKELSARKSGCFAVVERGRATLGTFDHAGWQSLNARRIADSGSAALAPLLAQELGSVHLAETPEQLFVAALEDPKLDFASRSWITRALQLKARRGFSPFEDSRYAMALCGVA